MVEAALPAAGPARFGIGRVLGQGVVVLGRNLHRFLPVMLLCMVPEYGLNYWARMVPRDPLHPFWSPHMLVLFAGWLIGIVGMAIAHGTLTVAALQQQAGERTNLRAALARGFVAGPKVAVATFIFWMGFALTVILLVIPGVIFAAEFWVYLPAVVVEDVGVFRGFGRSRRLTKGHRWAIFGLILVVLVVYTVLEIFIVRRVGVAGLQAALLDLRVNIALAVSGALLGSYAAVATALGYWHLRTEKEGITAEVAKVFD